MKKPNLILPVIGVLAVVLVTVGGRAQPAADLRHAAERAMNNLMSADSTLKKFLEQSAGYAVFPGVSRGGLHQPGTPVRGLVYEQGRPVGEAVLAEAHPQPQDGAAVFHEVICFENAEALEQFKQGRFVLSTDIGVVSLVEGAASATHYRQGAAGFAVPRCGLLQPIRIGTQRFSYQPIEPSPAEGDRANRAFVP